MQRLPNGCGSEPTAYADNTALVWQVVYGQQGRVWANVPGCNTRLGLCLDRVEPMTLKLPLLGLLEETLLPGEERDFASPAIQESSMDKLNPGDTLVALSIASRIELPSLVTARWATRCVWIATPNPKTVRLRGQDRVRLLGVSGRREPYQAEIEEVPDPDREASARAVALGAAQALMAVALGATPDAPQWAHDLQALSAPLLRSLLPQRALRHILEAPAGEQLPQLAAALGQHRQAREAAAELEEAFAALATVSELDKATRHSLWSQVVAIQRRLDVYDPMTIDEAGDEVGLLQRKLSQAGLPRSARQAVERELQLLRGTV
ncbi:MAG: hypothetical protein AAFX99_29525 [Myxococcota bacterium]